MRMKQLSVYIELLQREPTFYNPFSYTKNGSTLSRKQKHLVAMHISSHIFSLEMEQHYLKTKTRLRNAYEPSILM